MRADVSSSRIPGTPARRDTLERADPDTSTSAQQFSHALPDQRISPPRYLGISEAAPPADQFNLHLRYGRQHYQWTSATAVTEGPHRKGVEDQGHRRW